MTDLVQLLCVVVSVTGGVYCVSLLRNPREAARLRAAPIKLLPKAARRKYVCARLNRLCQVVLATAFLAVAASFVVGFACRALSRHWYANPLDQRIRQSIATVSIPGYPPVIFKYDSTQPDRPVYGIECHSKLISDEQVRRLLDAAPALHFLNLTDTDISDDALCDLSCAPGLRGVYLARTRVGDRGLRRLGELRNLEALNLDGTKVTDDGLRLLADVRTLQKLLLGNTAVTDAGLKWLGRLDGLRELKLTNTGVTGEGVDRLKSKRPDIVIIGQRNDIPP